MTDRFEYSGEPIILKLTDFSSTPEEAPDTSPEQEQALDAAAAVVPGEVVQPEPPAVTDLGIRLTDIDLGSSMPQEDGIGVLEEESYQSSEPFTRPEEPDDEKLDEWLYGEPTVSRETYATVRSEEPEMEPSEDALEDDDTSVMEPVHPEADEEAEEQSAEADDPDSFHLDEMFDMDSEDIPDNVDLEADEENELEAEEPVSPTRAEQEYDPELEKTQEIPLPKDFSLKDGFTLRERAIGQARVRMREHRKDLQITAWTIGITLVLGAGLQARAKFDVNSSLSADAAVNISNFKQLQQGVLPFIRESSKDDPRAIQIQLLDGTVCPYTYETFTSGDEVFRGKTIRDLLLLPHDKARLIRGQSPTDKDCPPVTG